MTLLLSTFAASAQVVGYAVNSDDTDQADRLLQVDLQNGNAQVIGALPSALEDVEGLAIGPDGQLYGVDSATKRLYIIDRTNASAQSIGSLGFPLESSFDFGLTFTCDGELLLVAEQTQSLYRVDTQTGAARVIGSSGGLGDAMTGIASFGGRTVALAADSGRLYEINTTEGSATLMGAIVGFDITDGGLAFDRDGGLWAITSNFSDTPSDVFFIDPATTAVTRTAGTRRGVESLAIEAPAPCDSNIAVPGATPQAIPVNAPWAIVVMVLGVLFVARRRLL